MKKRLLTITLSLVILTLFVFAANGCTQNDNSPDNDIASLNLSYNIGFCDYFNEQTLPFYDYCYDENISDENLIINSYSELTALSSEKHYPFFNSEDENYHRKLSLKIRSYQENFFIENSLIFIIHTGTYIGPAKIYSLNAQNHNLVITLSNKIDDGNYDLPAVMCTNIYVIEVAKSDIGDINTVEVVLTDKNATPMAYKNYGEIFSLEYAYSRGLISSNDLKDIGYYHNNGKEWVDGKMVPLEYSPTPKTPENLTEAEIGYIKQVLVDYVNSILNTKQYHFQLTEKDIAVTSYYGTYNGYCAILWRCGMMSSPTTSQIQIADTVFVYNNSGELVVLWKKINE